MALGFEARAAILPILGSANKVASHMSQRPVSQVVEIALMLSLHGK